MRLTCRSKKSKPPKELVRLLLRCAELRNMLQQVQLPESLKTVHVPCRTNEQFDLVAVLQTACGDLSPSRECMGKVLDLAVILCSSFEEQFKGWSVELDSSRRPKAKDDGYFKAVQKLVNACVGTNVIEGASRRGGNSHARCEKNTTASMTGKRTGHAILFIPSLQYERNAAERLRSKGKGDSRSRIPIQARK